MTGCTSGGYDQLETSPETIEQELQPAVCERRQTDGHLVISSRLYIICLLSSRVTYRNASQRQRYACRSPSEEETVHYSQVHHSGTANGKDADDGEFGSVEEDVDSSATGSLLKQFLQDQLFIYPRSVAQVSEASTVMHQYYNPVTVVGKSLIRPTICGVRTTVVQRSLQSVLK